VLARVYPVDPLYPYALRDVIEEAKRGHKVLIFPEGRVTLTGSLMKVYEGPGMVAEKADARILPLRIEGAQYTFFSLLKGKLPRKFFPKITITLLPAQTLNVNPALSGKARRRALSDHLYDLMATMIFTTSSLHKTIFMALIESRRLYGFHLPILEDISRHTLTYGKLFLKAFTFSRRMSRQTNIGDPVGLMLPNTHGLIISFWALQAIGRIPALLNYSSGAASLLEACQLARLQTVYTSRQFVERLRLQDTITLLKEQHIHVLYLEDEVKKIRLMDKLWGVYGSFFPESTYTSQHISPSSSCVFLFTSGSEGSPKGVPLSHLNLQANRYQLASVVDFNEADTVLNVLPLFHAFGLTAGMILPLLSGIKTFHYVSPLHYRAVAELVYDTGATILFGTDTFLSGYGRMAHAYDFRTLRCVFAGAEKLKPATQHLWFEKFGLRLFEGYGTTETSPVLCVNTPMHYKAGTVGKFLPGLSYRLDPVEGIESGGRLWVKGPNVMQGYLPLQHAKEKEEWYDTGDIAEVDEEGYVTLKGRVKRFAKVGGEMISLTAVEEAVESLWPGHTHGVLAESDPKKGERLILYTTYPQADKAALVSFWKQEGLSELSLPRVLTVLPSLPLLGSGKIDYRALPSATV
jgi:acyl-[acyl-carrier-protein]-phospholipid O-acyltransferase / long-chain-fatty-acid--[acyl-carrier-protein] ligase